EDGSRTKTDFYFFNAKNYLDTITNDSMPGVVATSTTSSDIHADGEQESSTPALLQPYQWHSLF
ncbi:MAG: hypothetical protein ACPG6D_04335, partial [Gammaproteobacteria bacterium]